MNSERNSSRTDSNGSHEVRARSEAQPPAPLPHECEEAPVSQVRTSARILLIDGDPVERRIVQGHLQVDGYEVEIAEEGKLGWATLEGGHFDLVLLGERLAHPSQQDWLDGLRGGSAGEANRDLPVIRLSGAHEVEVAQAAALEADATLHGPFAPGAFADALRDWLPPHLCADRPSRS